MLKILRLLPFLTLCACISLEYREISSRKIVHIYGAESKPPQRGIWLLAADTPTSMTFLQEFSEEDYVAAHARSYQLPDFASEEDFFRHVEVSSGEVTRSSLNGVLCFKAFNMTTVPKIYDYDTSEKLMKFISFKCLHPEINGLVVYIAYSLKHDPDLQYPLFEADAEDFFANMVFTGL